MGRLPQYNVCTVLQEHTVSFTAFYIAEFGVFRVVPVVAIAVLNVFIIVKVSAVTRRKRRRASRASSLLPSSIGHDAVGGASRKSNKAKKIDRALQLTVMLILVSSSYVILFLPLFVYFVLSSVQRAELALTSSEDVLSAVQYYTSTLYISGFAVNFFLYTVSGSVFRDQLKRVVRCGLATGRKASLPETASTQADVLATTAV